MSATNTAKLRKFYTDNIEFVQNEPINNYIYAVVGKSDQWSNESVPDISEDSRLNRLSFYGDIVGGKKISNTQSHKVARRIDWINNTTYDYYDDNLDLVFGESLNQPTKAPQFYVVNSNLDVYKCLDNNVNNSSTVEPTGQLSTSFKTADDYVWKYLYTITSQQESTYMNSEWMAIQTLESVDVSSQWAAQSSAVGGAVEFINVVGVGVGYNSGDLPTATISGDGVGATAVVVVDDILGEITHINIVSKGSGYTNATVVIAGTTGSGGVARVIMSPEGGHSSDAANELGGVFTMLSVQIVDDEGGKIPTGISYRKVGLIVNPKSNESGKLLKLSNVSGNFILDEPLVGSSGTGVVVKFSSLDSDMYIRVVTGSFNNTDTITGSTSSETATILSQSVTNLPITSSVFNYGDIEQNSGDLIYIEHTIAIDRLVGQVELLQFTLL